MKILVIEDEKDLNDVLTQFLKGQGFIVESVFTFEEAQFKINDYSYDCILVDITLPNGNGLELIKQLKLNRSKAGIIVISAKNSDDDKILGLDLGADDYLTKPFNLAELNSRINALIRRKKFDGENIIHFHELTIKPEEHAVYVNDVQVFLTAKEFDLLLFLIVNKNRVVSKVTIAEHLWGDQSDQLDNHDFIYVHLRNMRKKLSEKGCADYVETIYGIGYKFNSSL